MRSQARGRAALLIPGQCPARLVFRHPRLEEVLFLPQIGLLVQPGQDVFSAGEGFLNTHLARPPVGDETELLDVQVGVVAEDGGAQDVAGVGAFGGFGFVP